MVQTFLGDGLIRIAEANRVRPAGQQRGAHYKFLNQKAVREMKNQKTIRDLQEQWERGVERAVEDANLVDELLESELNIAVGLQVQSGVKSGGWTDVLVSLAACTVDPSQCPHPTPSVVTC